MKMALLLGAAAACALISGVANATVSYTFDTDNQGWTVGDVDGTSPDYNHPATWSGGQLAIGDEAGNAGVYAPVAVLGDQSGAYGGSIKFDVSDIYNDGVAYSSLILYGANGLDAAVNGGPPSTNNSALTTLSFTLDENTFSAFTGGDYASGAPLTKAEFQSILANLSGIAFRTEYATGPDDSRFDNAVFTGFGAPDQPPVAGAVPEPATWAMFIGGFGLVGAGMRHRRQRMTFSRI